MERENIFQILREQSPWLTSREEIKRDEKVQEAFSRENRLLYEFERRENLLITGPRQSGKTTYLKLIIYDLLINKNVRNDRIAYISCEPLDDFNDIIDLFRFFHRENFRYIFLDEITFVKEWEKGIKYILDSRLKSGKIIYITGSSTLFLKRESFPGRSISQVYHLPVNFKKFVQLFGSKNLNKNIDKKPELFIEELNHLFLKYVHCGGFPEPMYELMEEGKISEKTIDAIYTWIIGDIGKLGYSVRISNSVIKGIVKNYSTRFSLNSLAKEMEISAHKVVRDYLELLENLMLIKQVFFLDIEKRAVSYRKERKVYFIDPFLFRLFLKKFFFRDIIDEDIPKIVEGVIADHIFREYNEVFYSYNGREIDFISLKPEMTGIEVKWSNVPKKRKFHKMDNYYILSKNKILSEDGIIPVCLFLIE